MLVVVVVMVVMVTVTVVVIGDGGGDGDGGDDGGCCGDWRWRRWRVDARGDGRVVVVG